MKNTINSYSSNLSSFVGFDSAQKAWGHYKQSEYTACCVEIASTIGKLSCVFSLGVLVYASAYTEAENTLNIKDSNLLNERDLLQVMPSEDNEVNASSFLRDAFMACASISSFSPSVNTNSVSTLIPAMKKPVVQFSKATMVGYYIKGADSFNIYRSRRVAEMVDGVLGKCGSQTVATLVNGLFGARRFIAIKQPCPMLPRSTV